MSGFVDARDPAEVEAVIRLALPVLGADGLLQQLGGVPGLLVEPPRPRGLLRAAAPGAVTYGDRRVVLGSRTSLEHIVGGVVLSHEVVPPARIAGVVAALVVRAVDDTGAADDVSVLLTAMRDAAEVAS